MLCGGGLSDTNISGDFVRLLSKLSRLSVPLPRSSQVPKPSQERGREVVRSNSIPPQVFSWETQNSSMPCQDNVIIGRHNTLKLLCERCSNESTPSYNVHKPRKIRDHEPHQHFYKTISKTLDQMLRYDLVSLLHKLQVYTSFDEILQLVTSHSMECNGRDSLLVPYSFS